MMERGSGDGSLNHLTDEHWDFPTDLTDLHGRVSHRFRRFTRILFRWIDKNRYKPIEEYGAKPWCLSSASVL